MKTKVFKSISLAAVVIAALLGLFIFFVTGHNNTNGTQQNGTQKNVTDSSLHFVVMADCRGTAEGAINTETVRKTLAEIKKLSPQPSFALMPGDLAN